MKWSQLQKKYLSAALVSLALLVSACATSQQTAQPSVPLQSSRLPAQNLQISSKKTEDTKRNNEEIRTSLPSEQITISEIVPSQSNPTETTKPPTKESFQIAYFDFDSSNLHERARNAVFHNYSQMDSGTEYVLEGYCDEVGSPEYNLALGERRAIAVQKYLVTLGFPGEHLKTVSYGVEYPANPNHDEAAWAKNRRVETKPASQTSQINAGK